MHATPAHPRAAQRGRVIALLGVVVAYGLLGEPWLRRTGLSDTATAIVGMGFLWLLVGVVVVTMRRVERLPWSSLGVRRPTGRTVLLALGIGVVLMLLVPLLTMAAQALLPVPADAGGGIADAARSAWWLLLLGVATAAVCEEVLFRAYPIERLGVPGAVLGLAAFVVLHAGAWNAAHVLGVVLPLGIVLTGLYLWRRDLVLVMIVHAVIDAPLVVMAALG